MIKKTTYYLLLLLTITGCAQEAEDTIRLMPEGYQGPVLIIFNQKYGTPKEYEGDKRLYRIPENGILRTQFGPNYGMQKHQFFYVDNEGNRTEIPFLVVNTNEATKEIEPNKLYTYFERAISESFGINAKGEEYSIPPARTFYVGSLQDIDKEHQELLNFTFKHHHN